MITVIGLGAHPLSERARKALRGAATVAGGRRHLDAVAGLLPLAARRIELGGDLRPALDAVAVAGDVGPVVVLASGDPGFFGILRVLTERFELGAVEVIPALSSVASAFAHVPTSWDDALVVSAHGRDPAAALNCCRRLAKVAVLTSPAFGPAALGAALAGLDRLLVVVEAIGSPAERVTTGTPAVIAEGEFRESNVVLCLNPQAAPAGKGVQWPPRATATRWALPDDDFEHRDAMVTKAEVRALALAWLGPGVGDLVWDIGAGSGSVAIEAARLGAAVIAVEPDVEQCARIRRNAARHGVPVEVVQGSAPDALRWLPTPDAVFVGGGGAALVDIISEAAGRQPRVVVVALATVERVGPVRQALAEAGMFVEGVQLSAARLAPLGTGTRLAGANPVFLVSGRGRP
ncbi:MAG: precorrin-6y C5,15-methyltransferase (decarboxylating) subunit CbiE [Egibacteraceae bacterium]